MPILNNFIFFSRDIIEYHYLLLSFSVCKAFLAVEISCLLRNPNLTWDLAMIHTNVPKEKCPVDCLLSISLHQ